MKNILLSLCVAIVMSMSAASCHAELSKSGGPWKGQVMDAETGEAIEGAVVVIYWKVTYPGIPESRTKVVSVKEYLTDKEGRFSISGQSSTGKEGPIFFIYKNGYDFYPYAKNPQIISSVDKDNVVKLNKMKSNDDRVYMVNRVYAHTTFKDSEKTPIIINMIRQEEKDLGLIK